MHEQQETLDTCIICQQERRATRLLVHACGAKVCRDCATQYIRSSISSQPFVKPRCPEPSCASNGTSDFIDDWAEKLLRSSEVASYRRLASEEADLQNGTAIYCHNTFCRRYIPHDKRRATNNTATCSCKERTCMICKEKAHRGETCEQRRARMDTAAADEAERQRVAMLSDMGVKFCSQCKCPIEKAGDGCNILECINCGKFIMWK
ncbi:putative E3 ubiquitin-protein ligase ARI7 [Colletotrichum asianum]